MTFKDIRQGQTVYVLHRGEEVKAECAKVRQVGMPRFPQYGTQGSAMGMVIDVTIGLNTAVETAAHEDGENKERIYVVPADSEIACAGNVVISVNKEGMLREVEAMRAESAEAIDAVDKHKKRKERCEEILLEWDESKAEEKRHEERIEKLENKMNGIAEMIEKFMNKISTQ